MASSSRSNGVSPRQVQAGMIAANTLRVIDPVAAQGASAVNVVPLNQSNRARQRVRRGETLRFESAIRVEPKKRHEIGSYLDSSSKTVSRMLSRFQQEWLIQTQGKSIALLDFPALWRLSGRSPNYSRPLPEPILDREGKLLPEYE